MSTNIEDYRRWAHKVAIDLLWESSSARNVLTVEDLVQEGMIAMWRASETFDPTRGHAPAHLTNAARKRMIDVVTGRKPSYGTEGNRGRVKVPESAYQPLPEPGSPFEPIAGPMTPIEGNEALSEALAALSTESREYVERVFWGGERLRRDRAAWREAEAVIREHLAA